MGQYHSFLFYDPPMSNVILILYGHSLAMVYLVRSPYMLMAMHLYTLDMGSQ